MFAGAIRRGVRSVLTIGVPGETRRFFGSVTTVVEEALNEVKRTKEREGDNSVKECNVQTFEQYSASEVARLLCGNNKDAIHTAYQQYLHVEKSSHELTEDGGNPAAAFW